VAQIPNLQTLNRFQALIPQSEARRIRRWLTTETQRAQRGDSFLPDRETTIGQNLASPSGNI